MPDFDAIATTIADKFEDVAALCGVSVQYDNAPFNPPADDTWIRLRITHSQSNIVGIGKLNRYRNPGILIAQIFAPLNSGDGTIRSLAKEIGNDFRATTIDGVLFRAPSVEVVGENNGWWHVDLMIPFYADLVT